jgi:hypothetical protein
VKQAISQAACGAASHRGIGASPAARQSGITERPISENLTERGFYFLLFATRYLLLTPRRAARLSGYLRRAEQLGFQARYGGMRAKEYRQHQPGELRIGKAAGGFAVIIGLHTSFGKNQLYRLACMHGG